MIKTIQTICFTLLMSTSLMAQVVINEYSASNLESYLDNYDRTEDWIELYNTADVSVDLSGYHLSDKEDKTTKYKIPEGTLIDANGYLVFWCSGRDEVSDNNYHTNFKLAQTEGNDEVVFADPDGNIIEMSVMELTLTEHSRCKEMDGENNWMVCTSPTLGATNNIATKHIRYTNTPTIETEAGFYDTQVEVTLTNNDPGTTLRYTIDGTNPRETSPEYMGPLMVTETTVVKAQSFSDDDNILIGKMDFSTYFIDEEFSLAVFSVAADDVIELAGGNGPLIPIGSLEYFEEGSDRRTTAAFGSLNRHGQDSWVLTHRSLDWVTRDEMGYTKSVNAKLFSYSDRDEYQKFMFRNSGDDNYPALNDGNPPVRTPEHIGSTHIRDEYVQTLALEGGMKLDTRAVERVILFLNGHYWGVYGMRERPVDADYTKEYYDQDKYNTQFLSTWGTTEIEYGGQQAVDDWVRLRDFILTSDMAVDSNYEKVQDELNTTSLIDYMLMNLNVVAVDWLNYNTGWWRGINPDGDHKKWGYILWDLDATFDYYINYTGVPNENPDALPCDINDISDSMDDFWGVDPPPFSVANCATVLNGSCPYPADEPILLETMIAMPSCCSGGWTNACENLYQELLDDVVVPDSCLTITNGSCPYPPNDEIFLQVIATDDFCCTNDWDDQCQTTYDIIEQFGGGGSGPGPDGEIQGNFGKHEKIFIKLIEESPAFKQEYYSRQADLMNTVFSCENMMETLDRMIAVIEPEMPRQIDRWGAGIGTLSEWESNVRQLRDFIEERCGFLGEGMTTCYDLTGPFDITLMTSPEGVGDDIEFNSLKIEEFPWTGAYFGNMENIIEADKKDGEYTFSHWESTSGNVITPNELERKATINLAGTDTLIAVYQLGTATEDLALEQSLEVYPNPSTGKVTIAINMEKSAEVSIDMYTTMGTYVTNVKPITQMGAGKNVLSFDMELLNTPTGMYLLEVKSDGARASKRISYLR